MSIDMRIETGYDSDVNAREALDQLDRLLYRASREGCNVAESNRMRALLDTIIDTYERED